MLVIYVVLFIVSIWVENKEINLAKGIIAGLLSITFILMWDASWRYPILCLLFFAISVYNLNEFIDKLNLSCSEDKKGDQDENHT